MAQFAPQERPPGAAHEYPDPASAAGTTTYPWLGDSGALQSLSGRKPFDSACGGTESQSSSSGSSEDTNSPIQLTEQPDDPDCDPDYVSSGVSESDEVNFSSEDSRDGTESEDEQHRSAARGHSKILAYPPSLDTEHHVATHKRGGKYNVRGRGGRGIKRGLRKPIEPGVDFKAYLSDATRAFTQSDLERAELLTLRALQLNPEMFQAHSLLSEILTARQEPEKALKAAWNGAHTRHRDTQTWARVATMILQQGGEDRVAALQDAIYCYARIISVDKNNIEARFQRAALNRELGYKRKVVAEYEYILRYLPHDTTVLRHLADVYIEMKAADRALDHYKVTVAYLQRSEPHSNTSFSWSDVNIVAELYGSLERYEEGLGYLKGLSRWLLGRSEEDYWDNFNDDDREWDLHDDPRRTEVAPFVQGRFDATTYGIGLPLELRIRFGMFRLCLEKHDPVEAIKHFEWLEPWATGDRAKVSDFPDLFRETANALRCREYFQEALRFYQPLQEVATYKDETMIMELALCYRALGASREAKNCYLAILSNNPDSTEAQVALWNLDKESDDARTMLPEPQTPHAAEQRRHPGAKAGDISGRGQRADQLPPLRSLLPSSSSKNELSQKGEPKEMPDHRKEIQSLHARWKELRDRQGSSERDTAAWLEASKLLLRTFQREKVFFPKDRHSKFYGYSKEARSLAQGRASEKETAVRHTDSAIILPDGDMITIPDQYLGISFEDWLNALLEYSLELAKTGNLMAAYDVMTTLKSSNVFYHSQSALFLIHVGWFTCALHANDDESLCGVARWFLTKYQFVTDSYRLSSALHRLADSDNVWYRNSVSQKFVLRQLKAMDFSLLVEERSQSHFQERAAYTTRDSAGTVIMAEALDISLLMLYGNMLYAGRSYTYAINYFLRALAVDRSNATIQFSLALAYVHWALKRQAENRQQILMQGLAFLTAYYQGRQDAGSVSQRQEAEFNVARTYHAIGLLHFSVPYYERCLKLGEAVSRENGTDPTNNFVTEAALALQSHWAASGDMARAQKITQRYLVIE